jgi:hypothetical protein
VFFDILILTFRFVHDSCSGTPVDKNNIRFCTIKFNLNHFFHPEILIAFCQIAKYSTKWTFLEDVGLKPEDAFRIDVKANKEYFKFRDSPINETANFKLKCQCYKTFFLASLSLPPN